MGKTNFSEPPTVTAFKLRWHLPRLPGLAVCWARHVKELSQGRGHRAAGAQLRQQSTCSYAAHKKYRSDAVVQASGSGPAGLSAAYTVCNSLGGAASTESTVLAARLPFTAWSLKRETAAIATAGAGDGDAAPETGVTSEPLEEGESPLPSQPHLKAPSLSRARSPLERQPREGGQHGPSLPLGPGTSYQLPQP